MASQRDTGGIPATLVGGPLGIWPLAASCGAAVASTVALVLGANPIAIGAIALIGGLSLLALVSGRLALVFFVVTALTTVGLWDYFEANDLRPVVGVVTLAMVGALLATSRHRRFSWRLEDLGAAFVVLAASLPALLSAEVQPLLGIVTVFSGTYLLARVAAVPRSTMLTVALWIGAGHGIAAIIAEVLGVARLLPIPDIQGALATSRGIGLYLNPNTLGNVEAIVVVLALWWGMPRRQLPLLILVVAGLILSGSRESVIGAGVATIAMSAFHPWRVALLTASGFAGLLGAFLLVPDIAMRFDPRLLTTDPSLTGRLLSWDRALEVFGFAPILGHGLEANLVIDQAYLGWLVRGGIIGAAIWLVGLGFLTFASRVWPVVLVMAVGGFLANTFDGPPLLLLLLIAGVTAGPSQDVTEQAGSSALGRPHGVASRIAPPARQ